MSPRERPPQTRCSVTYTISTLGEKSGKAHVCVGAYSDGRACEVFLNVAKRGSDLNTVFDAWALTASRCLQWGVPLAEIAKAIRGVQDGVTRKMIDSEGKERPASSLWDAIAQTLEGHHG